VDGSSLFFSVVQLAVMQVEALHDVDEHSSSHEQHEPPLQVHRRQSDADEERQQQLLPLVDGSFSLELALELVVILELDEHDEKESPYHHPACQSSWCGDAACDACECAPS